MVVTVGGHNDDVLPFTRETPDRVWLGFVDEADAQPASILTRVVPVLAAAGLGLLIFGGGAQEHQPEAPPPTSAAAARPGMAVASASAGEAKAEAEEEDSPGESTSEPQAATDVTAPAEPEPEPKPEPKPKPKPPEPLTPAAARKAARAERGLRAALSQGRAAASREHFAVATLEGEDASWAQARDACSSLVIDGVRGWRLPSRRAAREIDRGRAAPKRAYWTRQRGRHDDTIYVYDPRTRRSSPWLDQEIALAVCVQPKPR